MGKNYKKELDGLGNIYKSAMQANVDVLTHFLERYRASHLYGIGSGGSYSVAAAFEYLCIKAGLTAQKLTPLELGQLQYQISSAAAVLFTAGGSNNDSKNAYQYISELEPEGVLTCCMRLDAPVKKIQRKNFHNFYYEYKMPVAKDGYLAVESLVSSVVLMTRAFHGMMREDFFCLPQQLELDNTIVDINTVKSVMERESVFILYGGITMPAAVDLESKFSEVSLGNTQLVDFRNFAHGRHYWLSDRRERTAIIALVGSTEKKLADNTLKLLPNDIPVLRVDVTDDTIIGLIQALYYEFQIVGNAAEIKNLDPGRPHIEEFGKKLYHLNYDISKTSQMTQKRKDVIARAVYRKVMKTQGVGESEYTEYAKAYWNRMLTRTYRGIIFDYDGTLHDKNCVSETEDRIFKKLNELLENNIKIGIATGRGKSVRNGLRSGIDCKYWKDIPIAYYNGGTIGWLVDDTKPDKKARKVPQSFRKIIDKQSFEIEENPYQLTLLKDELKISSIEFELLKQRILEIEDILVMETNHSIDIIPVTSSKRNLIAEYHLNEEEILTIGDSGERGGNDYELLKGSTGLSVDYVSESFDSCWNYAPPGIRNLEATEYYLNMIEICGEGTFKLKG